MNKNIKTLLLERIAHNAAYLKQSPRQRQVAAKLTKFGEPVTLDWVEGEAAAIQAENEFIEHLLKS